MGEFEKTAYNRVKRIPQRGKYDREAVYEVLDSHFMCHASYIFEDTAISIPTAYGRMEDTIYLHGAVKNRMLDSILAATKASLTITHLDGLVLARSVFHHSMNYRSAVVFGTPRLVDDPEEKMHALECITENIIAGRWDEARIPNEKEFKATKVVALDITEASAKIRIGPPKDEEEDYAMDVWAGVLPISHSIGEPISDPDGKPEIEASDVVRNFEL